MDLTVQQLEKEQGATAILSQFKDHTDPKYTGPGTWNVIHRIAFKARTKSEQLAFISLMKEICAGFPCKVCNGHCTEYIKNHPMEDYLNTKVEIGHKKEPLGLFIWSWKFHNAVNTRLKKPIMSWDTAYNIYSEKESLICSKSCLNADHPPDGNENNQNI